MPLYEYLCPTCGSFEVIRKFSDKPLKKCPTCSGKIEKLASAPAFQFKGTGWYVTDYAKKSGGDSQAAKDDKKGEAAKAESSRGDKPAAEKVSSKAEPSAKSESKSESKPQSKSESAPAKTASKSGSASGSSPT